MKAFGYAMLGLLCVGCAALAWDYLREERRPRAPQREWWQ